MRQDEVALQRLRIGRIDLDRGELSEAGIDAIDRLVAGGDFRNARRCLFDPCIETAVEDRILAGPVDPGEFGEGDASGVKRNGHDWFPSVIWPFQMRR